MSWKNYYAPIILLLIGLLLLFIAGLLGVDPVAAKKSTNFFGFDLAQAFTDLIKGRLPGLGLNIMAIAGFAFYMDRIGASKSLVKLCVKPLQKIRSPYVLAGLNVCGRPIHCAVRQFCGRTRSVAHGQRLSAPDCAGGIPPFSGCRHCDNLLPGLGTVFFKRLRAADLCGTDVVTYFLTGQGPVALCTIASVAIGHFFVQRWFDKREILKEEAEGKDVERMDVDKALEGAGPVYYAVLPMLPAGIVDRLFSPRLQRN